MATYYVRTDGNNANAGTGPASNQAWQTVTYALVNMVLTTGTNYLYIAPGIYRETPTVTVTPSSTQTLVIQGDPSVSMFTGLSAGIVRITNFTSDSTLPSTGVVFTCAKTYVTLKNLFFSMYGYASFTSATNIVFDSCIFDSYSNSVSYPANLFLSNSSATAMNSSFTKCVFSGNYAGLLVAGATTGSAYDIGVTVRDCWFIGGQAGFRLEGQSQGVVSVGNGAQISNCLFTSAIGVSVSSSNGTNLSAVQNSVFYFAPFGGGPAIGANTASRLTEDYNRISHYSTRTNVASGTNTIVGSAAMDFGYTGITGAGMVSIFAPYSGSPQIGAGIATNAPVTDFFGNNWTSNTDVSLFARTSLASTSFFTPTERNASTITIAPASTSQSIELYLGATGLTFSTSGLAAYYVRNQSAPVAITLVTQTPTGAWASGGFAEISSSLVPGVYRLDVPNAAFAAGASDVTIVVRGASGTNGAVLTVTLSSGGLTAAQTAAAVLDAVGSSYVTAGSIGYSIQNNNVTAIVGSTAAASELSGALLHNGTDYISAELVTPVTSAALVRMGPFEVRADGLGASDPLDIQKGAQHGIDIQCVDNNGAGIDITSATVTAKVYNSGATLIDTYSCTATYAADGRATFTIDTTVTNVPGTYTATITRTTGASDTQVFGPLRIYVRDI
jgi:hypothetical protein